MVWWVCLVTPIAFLAGCSYDCDLTTRPGHQLTQAMFVGSWILDSEQTNHANAAPDDAEVSDEILKGVFGKTSEVQAQRHSPENRTPRGLGRSVRGGSSTPDNLVVNEGNGEQQYAARFHDGDLCLLKADGKKLVLERD